MAVNGIRVHYRRTAITDLPPIFLLHGITDNAMCWVRVARALCDRFSVVMVDARGHGRSDGIDKGFSLPVLAEDAAGIITAMRLEKPIVFGHSLGAATAVEMAASHPGLARAFILEDPPLEEHTWDLAGWKADLAAYKRMSRPARRAKLASDNPRWDASEIDPLVNAREQVDPAVLDHLTDLRLSSWRSLFSQITSPMLLLTGDPLLGALIRPETADEASRITPGLRTAHVRGAGHCIHRDRWEDAMREVMAFILSV